MGKSLRKLGRGLAAGAQVFGQGIIEKEKREKEEARLAEQSSREERRLKLQEQESAIKQQQAQMNLAMKKVEFNNKMLVDTVVKNKYDPEVTGRAFSQYGPTGGRQYHYDPIRSAELGEGAIAYRISVYETGEDGNPLIGDNGQIKEKPLAPGSNTLEFSGIDEEGRDPKAQMVSYFTPLMAPEIMLAHEIQGITSEDTYQRSKDFFEREARDKKEFLAKHADTPQGREMIAKLEKERATADIEMEKAKRLKAGLAEKPTAKIHESELKSLTGTTVKRSKGEAQQDLTTLRIAAEKYDDVTSVQQAYWINEVKDNPQIRKQFMTGIDAVLDERLTEEQFVQKLTAKGLSKEFATEMLNSARDSQEEWQQQADDRKPGFFKRMWEKVVK